MNSTLKRAVRVVCAMTAICAGSAFAIGDITVTNSSGSTIIHPYFKSNCWNRAIIDKGPDEWLFAGALLPRSQFNWDSFFLLLDPKCRNPIVKFTYVPDGAPAPHETVVSRTVVLQYDASENTRLQLGDDVVVQYVTNE